MGVHVYIYTMYGASCPLCRLMYDDISIMPGVAFQGIKLTDILLLLSLLLFLLLLYAVSKTKLGGYI